MYMKLSSSYLILFYVNDTASTEIYTLSLHDALPISCRRSDVMSKGKKRSGARPGRPQPLRGTKGKRQNRSEERFSRNAETDLVCRLLLEKKKKEEEVLAADEFRMINGLREGELRPAD